MCKKEKNCVLVVIISILAIVVAVTATVSYMKFQQEKVITETVKNDSLIVVVK